MITTLNVCFSIMLAAKRFDLAVNLDFHRLICNSPSTSIAFSSSFLLKRFITFTHIVKHKRAIADKTFIASHIASLKAKSIKATLKAQRCRILTLRKL